MNSPLYPAALALAALGTPLGAFLAPPPAYAQPADLPIPPATTAQYPPGVSVIRTDSGAVYANAQGLTLYGMDMRTLVRWSPDPALYCKEDCTAVWEPLLAPAGAVPNITFPRGFGDRRPATPGQPAAAGGPPPPPVQAPSAADWTIIAGPQGPQWVYKGWHIVFVRRGDRPGSTEFDGADSLTWNTLKFIPPVPQIVAPMNIATIVLDGDYALADRHGRVLFTGICTSACGDWVPLAGGAASRGVGQWVVSRSGDTPQWTYRGKPVFVSQLDDPRQVPEAGIVLRP